MVQRIEYLNGNPVGVMLFGASFVIFSAENAAVDCGTSRCSPLALREGQDKFTVGSFWCHHKRGCLFPGDWALVEDDIVTS